MDIPIYYSSITGNTKALADYVAEDLRILGHRVEIFPSSASDQGSIPEEDSGESGGICILAFWCRRSGLDDLSIRTLSRWKGRRVLAMGTIGGQVKGEYGDRVRRNVREMISQDNECLGVCICQGSVDLKRIEKRRQLPRESKHHVSEEKYRRLLKTQGHPDQDDLKTVAADVRLILASQTAAPDV